MTPIEHCLIGLCVSSAIKLKIPVPPDMCLAFILGNILPDIDSVVSLKHFINYFRYHRGFTHTLLGCILLSFVGAFLITIFKLFEISLFNTGFLKLICIVLIGCLIHIACDFLTPWQIPFFRKGFIKNFQIMSFVDPLFVAILSSCLILIHITLSILPILLPIIYLSLRSFVSIAAYYLLKNNSYGENHYIFCPPTGIQFWRRGGSVSSNQKILIYDINVFKFKIYLTCSALPYQKDMDCGISVNSLLKKQYSQLVYEEDKESVVITGAERLPDDKYWVQIIKDKKTSSCNFHVLYYAKEFIWEITDK